MKILPALALCIMTIMTIGCGHQAERSDETPSMMAVGSLPPTQSNGVLTATLESLRRTPSSLLVRVRLENISAHPLELRNLGDTLTGFCCIIDGQRINAPVQRGLAASAASTLSVLPAQTPVELDLNWRFSAGEPTRGPYPFTVVIGNQFQDGAKLADLALSVGGPEGDQPQAGRPAPAASGSTSSTPAAAPATASATAASVSM
jgi:hypothetical protein